MKENIIKGGLTAILAGAAVYFHQLLGPLIVLAIVMIADYITGIASAWVDGDLSSRTGPNHKSSISFEIELVDVA